MNEMPASYAVALTRSAAADYGIDLLADIDTSLEELEARESISVSLYMLVIERYTVLQTELDWGFKMGHKFTLVHHGPLGYGAIAAPTPRDGVIFLARFIHTRIPYTHGRVQEDQNRLTVFFDHSDEVTAIRQRVCESQCTTVQSILESAGASTAELCWNFPYDTPANSEYYGHYIRGEQKFGSDSFCLEMPRAIASFSSPFRNDATFQSARVQCEALEVSQSSGSFVDRVRSQLLESLHRRIEEDVPVTAILSADEIAGRVGVSPRTLIRRLAATGTNYQKLKESLLRPEIENLIRQNLPMSKIADKLGYSDPGNFTRACRRMFGMPPRELRRTLIQSAY